MGRKASFAKHLAQRAIESVRTDDGRFITAAAVDELIAIARADPQGSVMEERWIRIGATRDVQSVPQSEVNDRITSAVKQLGIDGLRLNEDISVPLAKGREYIQLQKATPFEMKLAAQELINQGQTLIGRGNTLLDLSDIVLSVGGEDATIESLIVQGKIDEALLDTVNERFA